MPLLRLLLLLAPALAWAAPLFVIGDTGDCGPGAAQVAAAIQQQPDWQQGRLLEVGDLAYPTATRERLLECHEPYFGIFPRRLALPGNHDWRDPQAAGFYSLFPAPVPRAVNLDKTWRLLLLDSNLRDQTWAKQLAWLDKEVRQAQGSSKAGRNQATRRCLIAAWHHPRWSSGKHGDNDFMAPVWERLAGVASITFHGHDHHFEAIPPLDRDGQAAADGTTSFIVGNGGAALYPANEPRHGGSPVFGTWGFLRLDLDRRHYRWQAFDTAGQVLQSGEGNCLTAPKH
ncbi:MAG TPA: metallophosphoesterase [Azospira sp.]|nr:metallophosphoesterase [Azospira sp.]